MMSEIFTVLGLFLITFGLSAAVGSYIGRRSLLKDLGMTWDDYAKRLNGRRPT